MAGTNRFLTQSPPSISVVIPVYRSESIVPELASRLRAVLGSITSDYEVIMVNDDSPDASWQAIAALLPQHPEIVAIDLLRNYGQHNALLCGIRAASKDVIVTMDDDLQHPPEEIPRLIAALTQEADVVYGVYREKNKPLWRRWLSSLGARIVVWLAGGHASADGSSFRAFPSRLRQAFDNYYSTFVTIDVLLHWSTTRFAHVEVRHDARKSGPSTYNLVKLWSHFANMITAFSTRPLRVISLVGVSFTFFGLAILGYVLVNAFYHPHAVPGFAFIASLIALFSGAQMFALGVFGEYLARMHTRLMDRPPYSIHCVLRGGSTARSAPAIQTVP